MMLFCLNAGFLSAQVQSIDPSQTVNPATGAMGLALPLGTVQGINKGFPVNLYYSAGIQLDQDASPVGLGFGYEPGMITRKTVFVPDDAHGGIDYFFTDNVAEGDQPPWRKVINVILTVVSAVLVIIFAIVTDGAGASAAPGLFAAIWIVNGVQFAFNLVPLSPGNYIAGGEHVPSYPGKSGTGFFRGAKDDLPDMFFVNTPFLNGEFSWVGDYTTGHFVMRDAAGSNGKDCETVKIIKKTDSKGYLLFEIVLNDGTRLIFDKYDKSPHFEEVWNMSKSGSYDVCGKAINRTYECVPESWHLTKILYSDYVDGGGLADDPLDSRSNNKGEWVAFEYDSISKPRIFKAFRMTQLQGKTALHTLVGRINNQAKYPDNHSPFDPITLNWLKTIHTPVDSAVFTYTMDRKDGLWFDAENNNEIVPMPVLSTICFKNKDGSEKLTYNFNTGYDLRPNSFNSFKKTWWLRGTNDKMLWPCAPERVNGNIGAKSLTLRSINVTSAGKSLPPITFTYDENTNFAAYNIVNGVLDTNEFSMDFGCRVDDFPEYRLYERHWYIEQKDYWGYFRQNTTHRNDFNAYGSKTAACIPGTDIPYAAAWSLKKVSMPSGQTIEWEYEANRYLFANGVQLNDGATTPNPQVQYGGGIRVREIKIVDGVTNKNKTISYFYTQMHGHGNFEETPTSINTSGHATALPYPYLLDASQDKRPDVTRGGLYTAATVAYEQCIVVENFDRGNHVAPNGFTVYKFLTSKDFPNLGKYGSIDYSWKRGLLKETSKYANNGQLVDSTFSGYTFATHDTIDYSYPNIETQEIGTNEYYGGCFTHGWVRSDSVVSIHNGVRKKETLHYSDNNPSTKDYVKIMIPKSCMKHSSTSPTLSFYGLPAYTRTSMIKGTGAYKNTATVYVARGIQSPNTGDDVCIQAISNVDVTPGKLNMDNALWSNVKMLTSKHDGEVTPWRLTGMDAIAYNDDQVDDLLLQFVNGDGVNLIILQNVRVEVGNIVCDYTIPLRVTYDLWHGPRFQHNGLSDYMGGSISSSAVCNLVSGSFPDIVFYNSDHSSYTPGQLYFLADVDLRTHLPWDGHTIKRIGYDYSKSVTANIHIQDANGLPDVVGYHACFLDLDNDGKRDDWVATDVWQDYLNGNVKRTEINDVVIKNMTVDPTAKTITFSQYDPKLKQTTLFANPASGNFSQGDPLWSVTNTFGLVTTGNLTQRIYPFHFPSGSSTLRTLLYGLDKTQADADLDGQPNEIWSTAPNNKCIVTKSIPAYWKYAQMGLPTIDQPNNKRMLTQPCQKIVYAGPEATGTILREHWLNITGTSIDEMRTQIGRAPDGVTELTNFDCPINFNDHYGQRVSGYITAPQTGDYTFWIASDDNSELWLSTDECPSNAQKIAFVNGWTGQHEWTKFLSQRSPAIPLVTGKRYYIEALQIDNDQTDYLAVGWQGPGITDDMERPIPGSRLTPMPTPKNVVSSNVATWSKSSGTGTEIWQPSSNFSWKTDMNSSGLATTPFIDFNFADPSARDASWKYTGSIDKYTLNSLPRETATQTSSGGRLKTSIIYGHKGSITTGKVVNASFEECGVYTCDYGSANSGYCDIENGWEYDKASLTSTYKHFGKECIQVQNGGFLRRNFKVEGSKKYQFTAWVRVESGGNAQLVIENWKGNANVLNFPIVLTGMTHETDVTSDAQTNTSTKWVLMKLEVTAPAGNDRYFRASVKNTGSGNVYVDDIRFYPRNAMVTSTYYEQKWYKPILSVDANNNPSQKVEYDDFGRAVRWYKIDKTDPSIVTLLQQKEYHMMGDFYAPNPNKWYKIVPVANENFCIDIKDAEWRDSKEIHLFTYRGTLNQLWKFVPRADGYYNIVSKGGSGRNFGIDDPFGNPNNGTPLGIWPICDIDDPDCDDVNQQWKLLDAGDGFCRIVAHASNSAWINLMDGIAEDNRPIVIQNLGANTKWKLVEVEDEAHIKNATMDFYIGKTEVTQADYQTIMGSNPSSSSHLGAKNPVDQVTWYDAILYCNKRSKMEGLDTVYIHDGTPDMDGGGHCRGLPGLDPSVNNFSNKYGYRLPTELEWQAAYYYGTPYTTGLFWGSATDNATLSKYTWHSGNSTLSTHPIGQLEPNKAGLFDIAGNVAEWVWFTKTDNPCMGCSRWYGGDYNEGYIEFAGTVGENATKITIANFAGFRVVRTYR
jgi:hypothetical protein